MDKVQTADFIFKQIIQDLIINIGMQQKPFDMSNAYPNEIAEEFAFFFDEKPFPLIIKKKWYWRRKVKGWYKNGTTFYINSNGLKNRSIPSLVGTIAHEATHVIDRYSEYSFSHGSNNSVGKMNTAPYWIGRLGKKLAQDYIDLNEVQNV